MSQNPWKTAGMDGILQPGATGGNVFYVDGSNGNDGHTGLDPAFPLLTITYALSLCVDDHDDYIIVLDYPETHPGGDENSPIDININRVHVLGANYPYARGDMQQYLQTPDVAAAVFRVSARWVEIGYFKLAGGTLFGCIELTGAIETKGLSVHHCQFAEKFNATAGAPTYGIDCSTVNCGNWLYVGDCTFCQAILSHGITIYNAANPRIIGNHFSCVQGDGVYLGQGSSGYGIIADNYFAIYADDQAGRGIHIDVGATYGFLVANNMANEGKTDITNNPWVDVDGGVACKNAWMGNMSGDGFLHPA